MSIPALNWAMAQDQINNSATRFVLFLLCNYANEDGECYPSRETIAKKTSMSVRSVQTHLNWLTENGYICRAARRKGARQSSNAYQLQGAEFALSKPVCQSAESAPSKPLQGANPALQSANHDILQGARFAPNPKEEEEPSVEPKKKMAASSPRSAKSTKADERKKTRPDLDDASWLTHLESLDENRGIDVRGLYDRMIAWCLRNGATPTRRRLITWLATERQDVPVECLPPLRSKSGEPAYFKGLPAVTDDPVTLFAPEAPLRPAANVPPEQQRVWQAVLEAIRKKLNPDVFATWFKPLIFDGFNVDNNAFEVRGGQITIDWIKLYYAGMIAETLPDLGLGEFTVRWTVDDGDYEEAIAA